jgi:hypothetical protein
VFNWYSFDFTYLKGRAYYPQGHGTIVEEEGQLRKGLIQMLWNGRPLIVRAVNPPAKQVSREQPNARKRQAVTLMERIGDTARADEFDDMSVSRLAPIRRPAFGEPIFSGVRKAVKRQ